MKACFGMSLDPADYAWQLVQQIGFKEPAIREETVLDYLHLQIKSFHGSQFFSDDWQDDADTSANADQQPLFCNELYRQSNRLPKKKLSKPPDAALRENTVWVDCEFPIEKQRAGICHEVGHKIIPWHECLSYVKDGCIIDITTSDFGRKLKSCEKDANRFSAHLLMPRPFFLEDMSSLPFGTEALEILARRYATSIESTAIHYVSLATHSCALVMFEAMPEGMVTKNGSWLRVRYSKGSPVFDHFIRPGTEVPPESPIAQASFRETGLIITDEVPGGMLGLRPERRLILHCRPWGKEGDVLVLVEERQGNQGRFFEEAHNER